MTAAHGEQVLVTQAVVDALRGQLPAGVALRDLGNVRLRDLSSPERLHQVLHAQLRTEFPALRSLEATPNNLPQQLNSFIGREQELDELRALLKQHRLVTLLAMGGIGKSRLAVQLGAQVLDDFPDGVRLVELAPVTEPAAVTQAVARVLGVREEPGTPLIDSLLRHTRDRKLLVLLDNCEQVISACAELAKTLLQGTTGLSILATSRDPLSIAGENCLPLRPLAVPNPKESVPEQLLRIPAARLFVDRARAVRPDFKVDATNAQAVAQICHRLDGIALALELAAARVRVMTADAIAAGLDQRFKLLVSGDRTALPRQKTLHALIQWSYDLLEPLEARLFERLSVFAAGWALDAAEEVCGFAPIERAEVLDLLAGLVQKSLVLMDAETGRFRMLETVRAFGHERLLASADRDEVAPRHAQWCARLAEAAFPELMGPNAPTWLQRLDAEHENVMAALQWASPQATQVELAERLVYRMRTYWITRGQLGLAVRVAEDLLLNPALQIAAAVHCRALFGAGQLLFFAGQNTRARERLVTAIEVARRHQLHDRYRQLLQPLGMACLGQGDLAAARVYLDEGLSLAEAVDDPRELAGAVNSRAMLLRVEGALEPARQACERVLKLLQDSDLETVSVGRLNLAMVLIGLRQLEDADRLLRDVLAATRQLNTVPLCKSLFEVCCGRAGLLGDAERAASLYGAATGLGESTGLSRDPADEAFLRPLLENARTQLGPERFFKLSQAGRSMPLGDVMAMAQAMLSAQIQHAPAPA
jgi:predicted ATPase